MFRVALIGAGQIGSRHLQAISKVDLELIIEVVEPMKEAMFRAKERFEQMRKNPKIVSIEYINSLNDLSSQIDLAIIATGSDVRSQIISELLNKKKVKYMVLEKVLFQGIEEYYFVEETLKKNQVKCWVNHPKRMFPFYKSLKQKLHGLNQVHYCVSGGQWGLACNGLHHIDTLSFLTNSTDIKLSPEFLNGKIYESKRTGFVEFNGLLSGSIKNHRFSLMCMEESVPYGIFISNENINMFIDEPNGYFRKAEKKNGWNWTEEKLKIFYFQSELSHLFVEDILKNADCELPGYSEAMALHIPFIQTFLEHMEKVDGVKRNMCPIT